LLVLQLLQSTANAEFNTTLFRAHILNYQNYMRWLHDAPPVVEDQELADSALEWGIHLANNPSERCLHHNQAGGQNIYFAWQAKEMSEYELAHAAMKAFYEEIKLYDYSNPNFYLPAAHFTNLVWKSVKKIGIAHFKRNVLPPKEVYNL
ncbi:hypothetical protein PFISCL1PPCAC_6889, partial [Pristionchus fissidentatus]